jgi:protein SCO1/2
MPIKQFKNRAIFLFFLLIVAVPLLAFTVMSWYENNVEALPYYRQGTATESADVIHFTVPEFIFVSQNSIPLSSNFIKGKISLINYFFTSCPTTCPKMMAGMRLVQQAFPNDTQVRMVSLTVDPYHDTPAKLKRYAQNKNMAVMHRAKDGSLPLCPQWIIY